MNDGRWMVNWDMVGSCEDWSRHAPRKRDVDGQDRNEFRSTGGNVDWGGRFGSGPPLTGDSDRDETGIRIAIAMPGEPVTGTEPHMVVVPAIRNNTRDDDPGRADVVTITREELVETTVSATRTSPGTRSPGSGACALKRRRGRVEARRPVRQG